MPYVCCPHTDEQPSTMSIEYARGAIFFLVMPSTSDQYSSRVRPRAYEWTRRVVPIFTEFGIKPLDTWHPTDARLLDAAPTQSDGTHWGRRQTKGHSSEVGMSFVVNLIQQLCPEGRAPPEVSAATGDL
ncbi:hypothetical protein SARC_08417 [Sphaeroforma arctica JP610]|uniref:Uncharacterized protein n=1 Tax=Sphaeroforma arctica JP610 TaxID=667725 RepID=A0A0L0FQV2_9EUKA|nr:hypothetical protein SARC_08417 [Sphaeroforma arctica JP610]KNC79182.1 hypothetical protein SARC_08417 [Sphaeroforma arctica JP610]|eukprot:XP_014153084.1 hypothetical protein SARC_08417 [Sphaeroforma arctica JP610]